MDAIFGIPAGHRNPSGPTVADRPNQLHAVIVVWSLLFAALSVCTFSDISNQQTPFHSSSSVFLVNKYYQVCVGRLNARNDKCPYFSYSTV